MTADSAVVDTDRSLAELRFAFRVRLTGAAAAARDAQGVADVLAAATLASAWRAAAFWNLAAFSWTVPPAGGDPAVRDASFRDVFAVKALALSVVVAVSAFVALRNRSEVAEIPIAFAQVDTVAATSRGCDSDAEQHDSAQRRHAQDDRLRSALEHGTARIP